MRRQAAARPRCRHQAWLVTGLALCGFPAPAAGDATTSTMTVTATVQASCIVAAANLAFGVYTGIQSDNTATVTVTCNIATPFYVNLGDGLHNDGNWYPRMMGTGGALLGYRLYQNPGRTIEWRNTYNVDGQSGTGTGAGQVLTVYGRLLGGQYATPGAYSDTVTATVTY